ncbi:phosphotransferase [Bacillus sp. 179-C3.3 HS]|uniref:phosphotransferase n=1 Tax=Bacillus sp. 179-C3.3 HS TaxID=3232162 RepID=UPI0039A044CC
MVKEKLQALFTQPIVSVQTLGETYKGRANDVWLVVLQNETEYVVRSPKATRTDNEFTAGINMIYGVDALAVQEHIDQINRSVSATNSFQTPKVIRKMNISGRLYLVMEKMEGIPSTTFQGKTSESYHDYGRKLARLHADKTHFFGPVYDGKQDELKNFHQQLKKAVGYLTTHYFANQHDIVSYAKQIQQKLEELPPPESASLILIDLDVTQYIERDGNVMSLVDTEYVVYGPPAFDLIALEYLLTKEAAHFVERGYKEIHPLPLKLQEVRECYRFVSLLLGIHGSWDLQKWMHHPAYFAHHQ